MTRTKELCREDSYLKSCQAKIMSVNALGGLILDQTVFFPTGGGQEGDSGTIKVKDGEEITIATTLKKDGQVIHVPVEAPQGALEGKECDAFIDWEKRFSLMQLHTGLHILCSLIPCGVTGGQIGKDKARLDFDPEDHVFDKEKISSALNHVIAEDHKVKISWVDQKDLDMSLVRTVDAAPPADEQGKIRLVEIDTVDYQPCGGTHVRSTAEIKKLYVAKIENKGRRNKRVVIKFVEE